jgi:hypothetical protein
MEVVRTSLGGNVEGADRTQATRRVKLRTGRYNTSLICGLASFSASLMLGFHPLNDSDRDLPSLAIQRVAMKAD